MRRSICIRTPCRNHWILSLISMRPYPPLFANHSYCLEHISSPSFVHFSNFPKWMRQSISKRQSRLVRWNTSMKYGVGMFLILPRHSLPFKPCFRHVPSVRCPSSGRPRSPIILRKVSVRFVFPLNLLGLSTLRRRIQMRVQRLSLLLPFVRRQDDCPWLLPLLPLPPPPSSSSFIISMLLRRVAS